VLGFQTSAPIGTEETLATVIAWLTKLVIFFLNYNAADGVLFVEADVQAVVDATAKVAAAAATVRGRRAGTAEETWLTSASPQFEVIFAPTVKEASVVAVVDQIDTWRTTATPELLVGPISVRCSVGVLFGFGTMFMLEGTFW
jgi:hypothetical protein